MQMKYRSNLDRIPKRLLNECGFCHDRGLKQGILEVEFPVDPQTRERFSAIAKVMPLDPNGNCPECAKVLSHVNDAQPGEAQ